MKTPVIQRLYDSVGATIAHLQTLYLSKAFVSVGFIHNSIIL